MKKLSEILDEKVIEDLRKSIEAQEFPGITFEQAMKFFLTDGIVPASGLPVESILKLEDWARGQR